MGARRPIFCHLKKGTFDKSVLFSEILGSVFFLHTPFLVGDKILIAEAYLTEGDHKSFPFNLETKIGIIIFTSLLKTHDHPY